MCFSLKLNYLCCEDEKNFFLQLLETISLLCEVPRYGLTLDVICEMKNSDWNARIWNEKISIGKALSGFFSRHGHRMELFSFHQRSVMFHFAIFFSHIRVLWVNIVRLPWVVTMFPSCPVRRISWKSLIESGSLEKWALFAHGEKSAKILPLRNWANVKDVRHVSFRARLRSVSVNLSSNFGRYLSIQSRVRTGA